MHCSQRTTHTRAQHRRWLLALIFAIGCSTLAGAQVETGAEERKVLMSQIELEEQPIQRHLVGEQKLVLWLPSTFVKQPATTRASRFEDSETRSRVTAGRFEAQPGASLFQIMDQSIEDLREASILTEVLSLRRIRLATRPAVEITGLAQVSGIEGAMRFVVTLDPSLEFFRTLFVFQPLDEEGSIDTLYSRVLRDWTPLDSTIWRPSFERLRKKLVNEETDLLWDRRNRLLSEISQPPSLMDQGIGTVSEGLTQLRPTLLVDGLLHPHPRVRIAVVENLGPSSLDPSLDAQLLSLAILDPDLPVRSRVAQALATRPELAAQVLQRTLETDSEEAREAAFQLLVSSPAEQRANLVLAAFRKRSQFPSTTRSFAALLLSHWGSPLEAAEELLLARKTTRDEDLEQTALRELFHLGHPSTLIEARERLLQATEDSNISLLEATNAAVLHLETAEARSLTLVIDSLKQELENNPEEQVAQTIQESLAILEDFQSYAKSLGTTASLENRCSALEASPLDWSSARFRHLDCEVPVRPPITHVSIANPGALVSSLLNFLDQLQIDSELYNETYHAALDHLFEKLRFWSGDPVTLTSTGLDLESPLQFSVRLDPLPHGEENEVDWIGATLVAQTEDFETALDTLLRLSERELGVKKLAQGAMGMHTVPLFPLVLFSPWDELRATHEAEGSDSSDLAPSSRYVALRYDQNASSAEIVTLDSGPQETTWTVDSLRHQSGKMILTEASHPTGDGLLADRPTSKPNGSSFDIDLSGFIRLFEAKEEDANDTTESSIPPDLLLSIDSRFEPPQVATDLTLDGIPSEWLGLFVDRPATSLRAPSALLPKETLAWATLQFDPTRIDALFEEHHELLEEDPREPASDSPQRDRELPAGRGRVCHPLGSRAGRRGLGLSLVGAARRLLHSR